MSFVSRKGTKLFIGDQELQFLSFNTPNLHIIEVPWTRVDPFEQEDTIASISQLGGKVTRIYTFSIPKVEQDRSRHLIIDNGFGTRQVRWQLNEDLMVDLDRSIAIASRYNIKIIIPFIDRWEWWGGVASFAKLYGQDEKSFYSDLDIRTGWKSLLSQIILRNNTINGIPYREDPTILCWEIGNELEYNEQRVPQEWILDTARHIKQLDNVHLLMDGGYGKYGWDTAVLESNFIDIYSNHFYPEPLSLNLYSVTEKSAIFSLGALCLVGVTIAILTCIRKPWFKGRRKCAIGLIVALTIACFAAMGFFIVHRALFQNFVMRLENDYNLVASFNKSYILGETGIAPVSVMRGAVDAYKSIGVGGVLLWSLRGHSKLGGFHTHEEHSGYFSYHYPGFEPGNGFGKDEREIMQMVMSANSQVRNITTPNPPVILEPSNTTETFELRWRGSVGASRYNIEIIAPRIETIASDITDNKPSGSVLYVLDRRQLRTRGFTNFSLRVNAFGEWGMVSSAARSFSV
jgi:hypothetical protein